MNSENAEIMTNNLIDFFKKRPDLRERFIFPGTFKEYAGEIFSSLKHPQRHSNFRKRVIEETQRILGDYVSSHELESQLKDFPLISYADHHGLLNYKLLYNSNILYSLILAEKKLPFVFVLATGNIPLKNISYPRGFYFKGSKFNFFRKKLRDIPVYLVDNKLQGDKNQGLDSIILSTTGESLNNEEQKFIRHLFFDCLEIEKASKEYDNFADQVTFLNYKLWKYFFDSSIRDEISDIIYIQSNHVVTDILIEEIQKEDSLISLILFNPKIRDIYLKNFTGIKSCWGDGMGSQFFWGISSKKKYISFTYDEPSNTLLGEGMKIPLEREPLVEALKSKSILPTLFFDFLIITFTENFLALGGLNQVEFLPEMQKSHIKSFIQIGKIDKAADLAEPVANGLICGMLPFEFDSVIDLIWHYNSTHGKFNGNLDRGLTRSELDRVNNTLVTELVFSGIDKTLGIA